MKPLFLLLLCIAGFGPTAQAQLFSDNFTRGTDPGPLTPWTTNVGGGNWSVTGGAMKGGINPAFSYALTFITNRFTNYSAQARIQFPVGAFGGGLGGRLDPVTGTRYAAWVYPENATGDSNVLKLLKFTSYSAFTVLEQTNLTAVGTSFHTLKLEFASANQINVYFDSNKVVGATDATPYSSGAVSLEFWTDAAGYLFTADDVTVNSIPLGASNDTYAAVSGLPLRTSAPGVLANDTGGAGPLTAVLVSSPAHGTFTLTNNGGFAYTATNGYVGADSFTYRATDGVSTSSVATASITVAANHAPVANNDSYSVVQDTALTVAAAGVLGNDTDQDGNSLTAALVSGVAHGTLSLSANGGFTYTPTSGFAGTDSFTYRANDGLADSANATVSFSVLSIIPLFSESFSRTNLSPWVAQSGNWAVTNGALRGGTNPIFSYGVAYITNSWSNYSVQASVQLPAGAFGAGVDACLDTASGARYSAWIYPEGSGGGALTLKLIKFRTYSSFAYNGVDSVPMQSVNLSSVGTGAHNLKLACAGSRIAVFFDGTLMISHTDIEAQPYLGGAIGADFWTDAAGYQMSVDDVLVASLVNDDNYSTTQNAPLTVNAPGVLGNDTEIYGSSLTAVQVTGPAQGTLNLNSDGGFTYTPTAGYIGPDSFTYQANDAAASLGVATVHITVLPGGFSENFDGVTAPALPSGWTTSSSGSQSDWITSTTTSDTAPNAVFVPNPANVGISDLVSPSIALSGGQARLSFRNNYNLEYDTTRPTNGFDGGVLEIKIGAGSFTDIIDAGGSFVSGGYNATISVLYSNSLSGRQAWSGNSGGFVTTTVNLPAAAAGKSVQLRWRCGTDNSTSSTGWYVDSVATTNCACACCWNTPPLLTAQTNRMINELTTLMVSNPAVDADSPNQTLTYTLLAAPSGASIANGVITWTPTEAQGPGSYTITTRVTDNGSPALSATNSFIVVVNDVNSAPVPPAQTDRTILELTALTVTNTATDSDLPANTLTYSLLAAPSGAGITNGVITWIPTEAQGQTTNLFTTRVVDNGVPSLSATNTFTVVVNESNSAPVLPAQANRTIAPLSTLLVTNTATDSDLPVNTLTYTLLAGPTNAAINTNTGLITWSPTPAQVGTTNLFRTVVIDDNPSAVNAQHLSATNSFTVLVSSGPMIAVDATALVGEGFRPTNNALDPGEMVTLLFGLKNVGGANTTNLVVTMLQTGGVLSPSAPQTYGVLQAGGAAASQPFTFTIASGTCGGSITPTLQLQDGPTNYGTALISFTVGQAGTVLTQNFDTVTAPALPAGWSRSPTGGLSGWITTNSLADTAPNAAFSPDAGTVTTNDLVSPPILLSLGQSQLSFRHSYSFEADPARATNGFDGGVLEIKIGTNSFTDITNNGGSWIANGYNRKIDTRYANPLAARWAWSGTNGGYVTTTVALPPTAAGETIQLRWRCGTDNGGTTGNGWRVDSIGLSGTVCGVNTAPVLPQQADRTISELTTLTVTNTASDLESPAEALAYSLPIAPVNAVISTNGVITWTPNEAQGPGSYTFTTVVSDNASPAASATNTFAVTVNEVNTAPILTVPANQTIDELVPWSANATATDTDSPPNTLTFELVAGPGGLTVSSGGLISWTPAEIQGPGTYPITVRVFDNGALSTTNSFVLTVNEVNSAPVLTVPANQTINELVPWGASATATDADSPPNTLTFELVSGPSGLTVSSAGLIGWTPTEAQGPGTYPITVRVFDNGALSTTNGFALTVNEVNSAPVLTLPASQTIDELVPWSANATATDTDSPPNTLTFELVSGPSGLTVSSGGLISWTATEEQGPTTNTVSVRVFDNGALSTTNSFALTVNEVNSAPVLTLPASQTIDELVPWSANATATDTDSPPNTLTFELVSGPSGLTVSSGGLISWNPTEEQGPTTNTVSVRVFDNGALSTTNSFALTVNEVNSAPVLTLPASQTIDELVPWSATATATDTDSPPNTLTFELVSGPGGLTVSSGGLISWTATEEQGPTTNTVSVRVFDNGALSTTNSFALTVNEVNIAPVLTLPANQTIDELAPWSANATATDTDSPANTLTFELVSGPGGLTISSGGLISWTATEEQGPTTNTVSVRVFDNGAPSLSVTNSFTLTVSEVNIAPVLTLPANQAIDELAPWSANATATDTDSPPNTLTFELVSGPSGLTVSSGGLISWVPTEAQGPTTNTVSVRVFDNGTPSLSVTNSFALTVNEVNSAPVLTLPTNQVIEVSALWNANATAIDTDLPPNILTFELVSGPSGLTVGSGGAIGWTPTEAQASSTNTVTMRVFDDGAPSLSATNSFIVTVKPPTNATPPVIQTISMADGVVTITWSAVAGRKYRLQCQDLAPGTNWFDELSEVQATGSTATCTNAPGAVRQRFYRVYLMP